MSMFDCSTQFTNQNVLTPLKTTMASLCLLAATAYANEPNNTHYSDDSELVAKLSHGVEERNQLIPGLEELVVTGTRTAHKLIDAPVKVEVVSNKELENMHAMELQEGLKIIPGVQIKPVVGKEGSEAWIQGISANRVLILIDGEPMTPTTGSSVDLTQISVSSVERIEVVKGASSALYGSQALGGVINVITASPEPGLHGKVNGDIGSYGDRNPSGEPNDIARQRAAATLSYATDTYYIKGDVSLRFSDGWKTDPASIRQEGAYGHRNSAAVTVGLTPTDASEYSLRYEHYDQELGTIAAPAPPINQTLYRRDDAQRDRIAGKAQWLFDTGELKLQAFHEKYTTSSVPTLGTHRETDMPMSQVNLTYSDSVNEAHTVTLGGQLFTELLSSKKNGSNELLDPNNPTETTQSRENIEAFIQDEWLIGDITLVPGVRLQNDNEYGTHLAPKLNFRFDASDNFFIRGGVGTGYRVSNLKERYYLFDHSNIGYVIIGNSELKPEESTSYQLGFVVTDNKNFQAEINFFRNDLSDLIEAEFSHTSGVGSDTISVYQYQNVESAYTQGVELSTQFSVSEDFSLRGGYTYLNTENEETGAALNDRPEHQFKLSFNYMLPWQMNVAVIYNWQSEAYEMQEDVLFESGSWEQIDLKLSQHLYGNDTSELKLYGGIDNVTDQIQDFTVAFDNRPSLGRVIYTGLAYNF